MWPAYTAGRGRATEEDTPRCAAERVPLDRTPREQARRPVGLRSRECRKQRGVGPRGREGRGHLLMGAHRVLVL